MQVWKWSGIWICENRILPKLQAIEYPEGVGRLQCKNNGRTLELLLVGMENGKLLYIAG